MKRFDCLTFLATLMDEDMLSVTSLSSNYREWATIWGKGANFYALNLGTCLPFALGVSLAFPRRKVIALDSDGSLLVDTSALVAVADVFPTNLVAIVFDNESYARMGPTATARRADLARMAAGAGIQLTGTARTLGEFADLARQAMAAAEPAFIVAKIEQGRSATLQYDHSKSHGHAMTEAFLDAVHKHPDYVIHSPRPSVPSPLP